MHRSIKGAVVALGLASTLVFVESAYADSFSRQLSCNTGESAKAFTNVYGGPSGNSTITFTWTRCNHLGCGPDSYNYTVSGGSGYFSSTEGVPSYPPTAITGFTIDYPSGHLLNPGGGCI